MHNNKYTVYIILFPLLIVYFRFYIYPSDIVSRPTHTYV